MQDNRVVCGKGGIDSTRSLHDALLLEEPRDKNDGVLLFSISLCRIMLYIT